MLVHYLNPSTQEAGDQPDLPSKFQASQSCDLTRSCLKNKNKTSVQKKPGFVMHTRQPSMEGGRRIRRQRPPWATVNSRPTWAVCDLVTISPQTQRKLPGLASHQEKALAARTDNQFYSWDSRSGKRTDSYNQFLTSTYEPWHMCTSPTSKLQIKL